MRSQSHLGLTFDKGKEYSDLMTLVERCVRADLDREKLASVDPQQLLERLRTIAMSDFPRYLGRNGTSG